MPGYPLSEYYLDSLSVGVINVIIQEFDLGDLFQWPISKKIWNPSGCALLSVMYCLQYNALQKGTEEIEIEDK